MRTVKDEWWGHQQVCLPVGLFILILVSARCLSVYLFISNKWWQTLLLSSAFELTSN